MACVKYDGKSGKVELLSSDWKKISMELFLKVYPFYSNHFPSSQEHIEVKPFVVDMPEQRIEDEECFLYLCVENELGVTIDLNIFLHHCKSWAFKERDLNIRETADDVSVLSEEGDIMVSFLGSYSSTKDGGYQEIAIPYSPERLIMALEWIVENTATTYAVGCASEC